MHKEGDSYVIDYLKWGLETLSQQSASQSGSARLSTFNCRTETMMQSPFWSPYINNHCLVLMQGYYEWQTDSVTNTKTPYFIKNKNQELLMVAGLMNSETQTFTVLTKSSVGNSLEWLHSRVPVLQDQNWITEQNTKLDIEVDLQWYRVGNEVGNVRKNGKELMMPYVEKQQSLKSFFSGGKTSLKEKESQNKNINVKVRDSEQVQNVLTNSKSVSKVTKSPARKSTGNKSISLFFKPKSK